MSATLPDAHETLQSAAEKILALDTPVEEQEQPLETSEDTTEEVEDVNAEVEQEAEVEEPDQEPEIEAESEAEDVRDELTELSEWLSDPDAKSNFDKVKIKTLVDGKEGEATLADLVKTYQINSSVEERAEKLKAKKADFETETEQLRTAFNERITQAEQLAQVLEQNFLKGYEKVNWEELRDTDPAEFSAKKQEYQEAQQGLVSLKQSMAAERQRAYNEQYNTLLERESARLPEIVPEWSDEATARAEKTAVREYLIESGFKPTDIDGTLDAQGNILTPGIVDARAIALARKAMLYDKGQQKVETVKKKVRHVPKMAKPGKPETGKEISNKKLKEQRMKLKKSGRVEDAAALLSNII